MSRAILARAARLLEEEAAIYRGSYTLTDGSWPDSDDDHRESHQRHDRLMKAAAELQELARREGGRP